VKVHDLARMLERWDTYPGHSSGQEPRAQQMPPSSPAAAAGVLDLVVMESFRELQHEGSPDLLEELIDLYLADTKARLAELRPALHRQDVRSAQRTIHSLKGSSENLGIRAMGALCSQLEAQLSTEASEEAEATLTQLEDEFERVQEALTDQLEKCEPLRIQSEARSSAAQGADSLGVVLIKDDDGESSLPIR